MPYIALNAKSTLASALTAGATNVVVETGHGSRFAVGGDYSYLTLQNGAGVKERVKLTAQTGDSLTIVRAQDGTIARDWNIGDVIECRPCKVAMDAIIAEAGVAAIAIAEHLADASDAHAASAISYAGSSGLSATDVEAALDELDAETAKLAAGNTFAGANTFSGKNTFSNTVKLDEVLERITITASSPAANFDCLTQGIQYFTSNTSANWSINFRGDGSNSLNSKMATGESLTVTILATQSTTGYLPTTHTIDGNSVTPKVLGGTAWTADASCTNAFTYTIIKTADATFTVLASKSKYA